MSFLHFFKKPEYYFRPISILKRLFLQTNGVLICKMPWGGKIEINSQETIGKAIYKTGVYDLAVTELLWRLVEPGDLVLDVGANIGYTTNICSLKAGVKGRVLSFEPNPLLLPRLLRNINHNKFENVTLYPFALSNVNGKGNLMLPDSFDTNEGVAFIGCDKSVRSVEIEMKKLDDICVETKVNVLKIDVEGHELHVFFGALQAFKQMAIRNIIFEDHQPFPSPLSSFLERQGYQIFRIETGWLNIHLKNPSTISRVSSWEPTNYFATLDFDKIQKKLQGIFYKCL